LTETPKRYPLLELETVYSSYDKDTATHQKSRLVGPWSEWVPVTNELQADADAVEADMKAAAGGKTLTERVADRFRQRKEQKIQTPAPEA
jgi:hypothetical protein